MISVCSDNPLVHSWTEVRGPLSSFSDQVEEKVQVLFFRSVVLPESNRVRYANQTKDPRPLTICLEQQVLGSWQHVGIWTPVVVAVLHGFAESGWSAQGGVNFLDAALIDRSSSGEFTGLLGVFLGWSRFPMTNGGREVPKGV